MSHRKDPTRRWSVARVLAAFVIMSALLNELAAGSSAQAPSCDCGTQEEQVREVRHRVYLLETRNQLVADLIADWDEAQTEFERLQSAIDATDVSFKSLQQAVDRHSALQATLTELQAEIEIASDPQYNPYNNPFRGQPLIEYDPGVNNDFRPTPGNWFGQIARFVTAVRNFGLTITVADQILIARDRTILNLREKRVRSELDLQADYYRRSNKSYQDLKQRRSDLARGQTQQVTKIDRIQDSLRDLDALDVDDRDRILRELTEAKAELQRAEEALKDCMDACRDCPNATHVKPAHQNECFPRYVPIDGWVGLPDSSNVRESPSEGCKSQRQHYEPEATLRAPTPYDDYWSVYDCNWEGGLILPGQASAVCPDSLAAYRPAEPNASYADGYVPMIDTCVSGYHELQPPA